MTPARGKIKIAAIQSLLLGIALSVAAPDLATATSASGVGSKVVCSSVAQGSALPLRELSLPPAQTSTKAVGRFHETIRSQLTEFQMKPQEVQEFISSFPSSDQIWVKDLLIRLTQWGQPSSLAVALKQIQAIAKTDAVRMISFSPADIVSVLGYLNTKDYGSPGTQVNTILPRNVKNGDVILLSPEFKSYVEENPSYAEKLASLELHYVSMEGFDSGLHFANSLLGVESLRNTVAQALSHVKKAGSVGHEVEFALGKMGLNRWFKNQFPHLSRRIRSVSNRTSPLQAMHQPFADQILSQINSPIPSIEDVKLRLARMELHLARAKKKEIPDIHIHLLNHFSEFMRFVDHRTLQAIIMTVGHRFEELVNSLGVDPKTLDFWVPKRGKSYGLVNFIRRELRILPEAKSISRLSPAQTADRTIILMDDVAASGESLETHIETALKAEPKNLIVAPIFLTKVAERKLKNALTSSKGLRAFLIKGQLAQGAATSPYSKSQKRLLREWLADAVGSSYGDVDLALAFPYMSPDNNVNLFSVFFADLLTPRNATKLSETWTANSFPDLPN